MLDEREHRVVSAPHLSVVVPVHDEGGNIVPLIDEIRRALAPLSPFEIVVVDDGSADDTLARLEAAAVSTPELRIIRHVSQAGQSTALYTGVRYAHAPLIATLDGDGQNDPADVPALLARYRETVDGRPLLVIGHRTARRDSFVTRASSRIANSVRAWLLKDRTLDTGCGLKLFARDLFLALPYFDHMHRFLPALVLRSGGRVVSVPVRHRPRTKGQSHYGIHNRLWIGIVDLLGVAWLMRRSRLPDTAEHTRRPG